VIDLLQASTGFEPLYPLYFMPEPRYTPTKLHNSRKVS
jgi:hypothetical protein